MDAFEMINFDETESMSDFEEDLGETSDVLQLFTPSPVTPPVTPPVAPPVTPPVAITTINKINHVGLLSNGRIVETPHNSQLTTQEYKNMDNYKKSNISIRQRHTMSAIKKPDIRINIRNANSHLNLLPSGHDDPILNDAIKNITAMKRGVTSTGKRVPIKNILTLHPNTFSEGKKHVKVTQQLIDNAYVKLQSIVDNSNIKSSNMAVIVAYALQISNKLVNYNKTYKIEKLKAISLIYLSY